MQAPARTLGLPAPTQDGAITLSPQALFRRVAIAEAITWTLLLVGMFLKYVTETTELGVRVFGMLHGVAFVTYCVVSVVVAVDQRWSIGRLAVALLASIPPLMTVPFDLVAERRGWLAPDWRLRAQEPATTPERLAAGLVRRPARGVLIGVAAVVALTGAALLVAPPG